MRRLLSLLFCLFWFISCDQQENFQSFWDKTEQSVSSRVISGSLEVFDSVNLHERFDMINPGRLLQNQDYFIITDRPSSEYSQIYIISKSEMTLHKIVRITHGRGPGEVLSLQGLAVNQESLLLSDMNLQKIVLFDLDGNFIKEVVTDFFMFGKNQFRSDGLMVLFSNPMNYNGDPLFFLIDTDGRSVDTFGNISEQDFSHLKVYGNNVIDKQNNFYYASYAEHILKKWSPDGQKMFSVGTVGNPESDFNYISSMNGEDVRIMGYAEGGYYSTSHIFLCEEYICIEHAGDIDFEPSIYLDLYSREDGTYQFSYNRPTPRARGMLLSDGVFYGLQYFDDEMHLVQFRISE
jgi:hypothetical protein